MRHNPRADRGIGLLVVAAFVLNLAFWAAIVGLVVWGAKAILSTT